MSSIARLREIEEENKVIQDGQRKHLERQARLLDELNRKPQPAEVIVNGEKTSGEA